MPSVETRTLFKSLQLGSIATTGHRVVLAPLTRFRAHDSHVHSDMVVEYYSQRCNEPGTVLITEATFSK